MEAGSTARRLRLLNRAALDRYVGDLLACMRDSLQGQTGVSIQDQLGERQIAAGADIISA